MAGEIKMQLDAITDSLRNGRNAIIGRGGNIAPIAGFKDFPSAIYNIPADNAIATVIDESVATVKTVPAYSTSVAYLAEFGGMTYKCKQLLPFPYYDSDKTIDGITYIVREDSGISVSGTAGEFAQFVLANSLPIYPKAYTFRLYGTFSNIQGTVTVYDDTGAKLVDYQIKTSAVVIDLTGYPTAKTARIYLKRQTSDLVASGTIYPMLNSGAESLPWEPYYEGLRNAKPTEIVSEGANLVKYPFNFRSYTHNGVTFTANDEQTITISGTPTANTNVDVLRATPIRAKAGETFTLSTSGDWTGKNGYVSVSQRVNGATIASGSASTTPKTFTVAQDCDLTLAMVVIKDYTYDGSVTIMLNRGSTAAPYKPYVGTISTRAIPEEIRALDGFGEGVSLDYYNKVDLVNQKYKWCIETIVLDGSEEWKVGAAEGLPTNYFNTVVGEKGAYVNRLCVSDNLEYTYMQDGYVGIDAYDSNAFGGFVVAIRPENVQDFTLSSFIEWLKANPITVKVARTVPVETDLSVSMKPLIEVEGGGTVEFVNEYGYGVPSKIIYQTTTE